MWKKKRESQKTGRELFPHLREKKQRRGFIVWCSWIISTAGRLQGALSREMGTHHPLLRLQAELGFRQFFKLAHRYLDPWSRVHCTWFSNCLSSAVQSELSKAQLWSWESAGAAGDWSYAWCSRGPQTLPWVPTRDEERSQTDLS